ncbi:MAG: DUF1003 domain-containing protein [Nitrospirota bacterium]
MRRPEIDARFRSSIRKEVMELYDETPLATGQVMADRITSLLGSWRFIVSQIVVIIIWITLNILGWIYRWDPFPFILLNLLLSVQAAFAGPIIMMSQNRQAERDRATVMRDYQINRKAEGGVREIITLLKHQREIILEMEQEIKDLHKTMEREGFKEREI